MSAKAAESAPATEKPKGSKPVMLIAIAAIVLLGGGAGGAWFFLNKKSHDAAQAEAAAEESRPAAPSYMALENMVVNLSDPGGERVAQVGITLELESDRAIEQVKQLQPKVRSSVLMLVSQRSSEELLRRDGKEKLAADVLAEVSRVLGYETESPREPKAVKEAKAGDEADDEPPIVRRKSRKNPAPSPVLGVLFSSFIVQ